MYIHHAWNCQIFSVLVFPYSLRESCFELLPSAHLGGSHHFRNVGHFLNAGPPVNTVVHMDLGIQRLVSLGGEDEDQCSVGEKQQRALATGDTRLRLVV